MSNEGNVDLSTIDWARHHVRLGPQRSMLEMNEPEHNELTEMDCLVLHRLLTKDINGMGAAVDESNGLRQLAAAAQSMAAFMKKRQEREERYKYHVQGAGER